MTKLQTIKLQQQEAYHEAAQVDKIINGLLDQYPPDKYPHFWATFTRTVISSLTIIQVIAEHTKPVKMSFTWKEPEGK